MLFDTHQETLRREELEALQLRRLRNLCARVYATVPFYAKRFAEVGVTPDDIKTLDDVRRLPFTEKQDLRNHYPFGLFAVPKDHIVRLHASSGTTGKAVVVGYTARDLENWAGLMARSMAAAGVNSTDVVHVAYGYGLFTGGLGAHYGAERLGATVVPASGGATRRQASLLRDFGSTVLCATPSYGLHLWEAAREVGVDFRELPLRIGIFGAEPWSEAMRRDIEAKMDIDAMNIYGLSEIMGPGVAMECREAKCGMHLWEDHILPEIIDPVTGESLPPGEVGELVLTTLTKEGIPLVRYRTRDLTGGPRPHSGLGPQRTHHSRGQRLPAVEGELAQRRGSTPTTRLLWGTGWTTWTPWKCAWRVSDKLFADQSPNCSLWKKRLQKKNIKEFLGVTPGAADGPPPSKFRGKAQRIVDRQPKD